MAQKSFKTRIEVGDEETHQGSTTWTPFAKVVEIQPPEISADEVETTHLESEDEFEDAEPTIGRTGDSTFKVQWSPEQNTTIYGLFRQKKGFRIVYADAPYPSGSKLKFNGWVKAISGESITKDNLVQADITIRVVGKPQFEEAA